MKDQEPNSRELPPPEFALKSGMMCSVSSGEGGYPVVKVLVVTRSSVHVCLYKNHWRVRPACVNPSELAMGTIHDPDGFGIGHVPLTLEGFFGIWKPIVIGWGEITDQDAAAYSSWLDWQSMRGLPEDENANPYADPSGIPRDPLLDSDECFRAEAEAWASYSHEGSDDQQQ